MRRLEGLALPPLFQIRQPLFERVVQIAVHERFGTQKDTIPSQTGFNVVAYPKSGGVADALRNHDLELVSDLLLQIANKKNQEALLRQRAAAEKLAESARLLKEHNDLKVAHLLKQRLPLSPRKPGQPCNRSSVSLTHARDKASKGGAREPPTRRL
jgi:hypothetical protein